MHSTRDDMNLGDLEMLAPPKDVWPDVSQVLERRERGYQPWIKPAAVALLVLSLGLVTVLTQRVETQDAELERWVAYSQELEAQLRQVEASRVVYRGHEAAAVSQLRNMVGVIDVALERTPQSPERLALWQKRAAVLNDLYLVQVMGRQQRLNGVRRPVITQTSPVRLVEFEPASNNP